MLFTTLIFGVFGEVKKNQQIQYQKQYLDYAKIHDKEISEEGMFNFLTSLDYVERYNKEVSGTTVTIQGTVIALSTARDGRDSFAQKYVLMADSDSIRWKFAEGWFTLSKTEVASIANAINSHVQSAFDWESAKVDEIESKTTAEELDAVVIVEPAPEPTPE